MTWVRHANRLEEENNGLKKLLEEALDHIDQYDYEESFDLVQRIKDAINHTRMGHPPVIPWSGSGLTEKEELLQKVQQLERDKVKMLADLQVESEINAKGGEREYVLRGKVDQLERENAAFKAENAALKVENADIAHAYGVTRDVVKGLCEELANLKAENAALREDRDRLDWVASRKFTHFVYFAVAGWAIIKASGVDLLHECNIHDLRAAIDAARAEEGQSWGIDEIIRQHLREGGTPT